MSEEERNLDINDPEAKITTEEPIAPQMPKKWQMPEPVFRRTSGYLPQGYEKNFPDPAADSAAAAPPPPPAPDPFAQTFVGTPGMSFPKPSKPQPGNNGPSLQAPAAEIEPQPDLPEEPVPDEISGAAPAMVKKERSRTAKLLLAVLFVLAGLAFITVFLGVVYYLFFWPSGESSVFSN